MHSSYKWLPFLTPLVLCAALIAQDAPPSAPQPSPNASSPEQKSEQKSGQEKRVEKQEQSQRMLGVIPQFGTTSRLNAPPLTSGEKFHLFAKSAFDPVELSVVGLQAAVSQGEPNSPNTARVPPATVSVMAQRWPMKSPAVFGPTIFILF